MRTIRRDREIDLRPCRHHRGGIDVPMALVVMPLDMVEVHGGRNGRMRVQLAGVGPQRRIVHQPADVALEMSVVHRVEPQQRGE